MNKVYIFAEKNDEGNFDANEISDSISSLLENLEYGDVAANQFQVWEYPSGKIYNIVSDRELPYDDYSTPSQQRWLPKLSEMGSDLIKVESAFMELRQV